MPGTLTLVGTPIGNLSDFSPRAVAALEACDFIAAEDTRVSLTLLNHFHIKKPLVSYFEHNKREKGIVICQRLEAGENAVLVTDAGMPAISDPGEDLVALCHEKHIPVTVVPGPSAVVTALALSGMPSARFTFEGFLSVSRRPRMAHLESLRQEQRTMIFYEAPHKLSATLDDMLAVWGDRRIALVRELTKIHEEVIPTTLSEATRRYHEEAPRGEFVLVIDGCQPLQEEAVTLEEAAAMAQELTAQGLSASEAARRTAAQTHLKKNDIYRLMTQQ